jgi:hypothetical protein
MNEKPKQQPEDNNQGIQAIMALWLALKEKRIQLENQDRWNPDVEAKKQSIDDTLAQNQHLLNKLKNLKDS